MAENKTAAEMTLPERLKFVAKWHFRGTSNRKIAAMLSCSSSLIDNDVKRITSQMREHPDIDEHLRNIVARLGEELTKIGEAEAECWQLMDWCSEEVVQLGGPFMAPIKKYDKHGAEMKDSMGHTVYEMGPRKPSMIPGLIAQISSLSKQKAEYLKIIGPKVDISVNLQLQLKMQSVIMERLKEIDPNVYATLYRELQVIAESEGKLALAPGKEDALDAQFVEVEHANR